MKRSTSNDETRSISGLCAVKAMAEAESCDPLAVAEVADRMFRADGDAGRIAQCLAEVVATTLPRQTEFELLLFVHDEGGDRYRTAARFGSLAPHVQARPYDENRFPVDPAAGESDHDLTLLLESDQGVLGFVLLRCPKIEIRSALAHADGTLALLSRLAGQALLRNQEIQREDFYRTALASSTRYLETILAATGDAILLVDRQGRVLMANEAIEAVLGLLPIDMTSRQLQSLVPNDTAVSLLTGVSLAVNQDVPVTQALRLQREDGEVIVVDALFERVQTDLEGALGVIICLRDLDQQTSEDWYLRGQRRQKQACAEFGQALLQPIAAMRGYLWLLRDELAAKGRVAGILSTLDEQSEWMQAQLETLTLMDEFRAGTPSWKDRPVSPLVIFERAEGRVRARLDASGVRVEMHASKDVDWIRVDVDKWIVVVSFLLRHLAEQLEGSGTLVVSIDHVGPAEAASVRPQEARLAGHRFRFRVEGLPEASARPPRAGTKGSRKSQSTELERRGVEAEYAYGIPLARTVIHHYGGTLVWDVTEAHTPRFSITLPETIHAFSGLDREVA